MGLAWVTGGSRGIGRAVALNLARRGHDIVFTCRAPSDAAAATQAAVAAEGRRVVMACFDLGDAAAEARVTELLREHGCPDILVNNAGLTRDGMFAMQKRDTWDLVMAANLTSLHAVTRPVIRPMLKRRSGNIVNLTSLVGQRGNAGQVAYATSKGGIIAFTKSLALELASRNIRVNAVSPGLIATDMTAQLDTVPLVANIPLGRIGTPEDVAGVVGFLTSPDAAYVTGQVIAVNGGLYT